VREIYIFSHRLLSLLQAPHCVRKQLSPGQRQIFGRFGAAIFMDPMFMIILESADRLEKLIAAFSSLRELCNSSRQLELYFVGRWEIASYATPAAPNDDL
jgi:hypothetical protein